MGAGGAQRAPTLRTRLGVCRRDFYRLIRRRHVEWFHAVVFHDLVHVGDTPPPQTSPRSRPEEGTLHPDGRILEHVCLDGSWP